MPKLRRSLPASYVVRIYRADPAQHDALVGLVEDLQRGVTCSFRTGAELLGRLADQGAAPSPTTSERSASQACVPMPPTGSDTS